MLLHMLVTSSTSCQMGKGEEEQARKGDEHHERGLAGRTGERGQKLLCLSVIKLFCLLRNIMILYTFLS